jgi:hypothetical protein
MLQGQTSNWHALFGYSISDPALVRKQVHLDGVLSRFNTTTYFPPNNFTWAGVGYSVNNGSGLPVDFDFATIAITDQPGNVIGNNGYAFAPTPDVTQCYNTRGKAISESVFISSSGLQQGYVTVGDLAEAPGAPLFFGGTSDIFVSFQDALGVPYKAFSLGTTGDDYVTDMVVQRCPTSCTDQLTWLITGYTIFTPGNKVPFMARVSINGVDWMNNYNVVMPGGTVTNAEIHSITLGTNYMYVSGKIFDEATMSENGFVMCIKDDGGFNWAKYYSDATAAFNESLHGIVLASNGRLYAAGTCINSTSSFNDLWTVTLDPSNGNLANSKMHAYDAVPSNQSINSRAYDIKEIGNTGEFMIGGVSKSFFETNYRTYLCHIDAGLNPLLHMSFNTLPTGVENEANGLEVFGFSIHNRAANLFTTSTETTLAQAGDMIQTSHNWQGCASTERTIALVEDFITIEDYCTNVTSPITGIKNLYFTNMHMETLDACVMRLAANNNPSSSLVFPVPASSSIQLLNNGYSSYEIINALGCIVVDAINDQPNQDFIPINTAALTDGIYLIQPYSGATKQASVKFIIKQ